KYRPSVSILASALLARRIRESCHEPQSFGRPDGHAPRLVHCLCPGLPVADFNWHGAQVELDSQSLVSPWPCTGDFHCGRRSRGQLRMPTHHLGKATGDASRSTVSFGEQPERPSGIALGTVSGFDHLLRCSGRCTTSLLCRLRSDRCWHLAAGAAAIAQEKVPCGVTVPSRKRLSTLPASSRRASV